MNKSIRVCSTEEEIAERMLKWHPHLEDFQMLNNNGADFILSFSNISEEDFYELDITFEDIAYGDGKKSLAETLVELLLEKDVMFSSAESLTGGSIASAIVEVAGCSAVFYGGIVSYSNDAKMKYLGVAEETIGDFGAVSKQTAIEMATGLLSEKVQIGVSTTGIAGPTGGSFTKPVGLVFISVTDEERTDVYEHVFKGDREQVRNQARDTALFYAIKHLQRYY
ncbi:MAG: CinA family protein [Clostridia bacterium]|nr:CinA family protein [Clostridia bacterium]